MPIVPGSRSSALSGRRAPAGSASLQALRYHRAARCLVWSGAGVPGWRNGRRGGLKNLWPKGRVGSTPTPGTIAGSADLALSGLTVHQRVALAGPSARKRPARHSRPGVVRSAFGSSSSTATARWALRYSGTGTNSASAPTIIASGIDATCAR
jgi:hypothetical protein